MEQIKIKMILDVKSELPFMIRTPDLQLSKGEIYDAVMTKYGAIYVKGTLGRLLNVKPHEFKIIEAPQYVKTIHFNSMFNLILRAQSRTDIHPLTCEQHGNLKLVPMVEGTELKLRCPLVKSCDYEQEIGEHEVEMLSHAAG